MMSGEDSYNGWVNRETWAVKLHWDNNQGDYDFFVSLAKDFLKAGQPFWVLADRLKEIAEDIYDRVINDGRGSKEARMFVNDVGSLWRVDWNSIAEAYYEEVGGIHCKVHPEIWVSPKVKCPICAKSEGVQE